MLPHPEKDDCASKFDKIAKCMLRTDVIAALKHKTVKTLGNTRLPTFQVETLKLKT
jgi:hypothetical protein